MHYYDKDHLSSGGLSSHNDQNNASQIGPPTDSHLLNIESSSLLGQKLHHQIMLVNPSKEKKRKETLPKENVKKLNHFCNDNVNSIIATIPAISTGA